MQRCAGAWRRASGDSHWVGAAGGRAGRKIRHINTLRVYFLFFFLPLCSFRLLLADQTKATTTLQRPRLARRGNHVGNFMPWRMQGVYDAAPHRKISSQEINERCAPASLTQITGGPLILTDSRSTIQCPQASTLRKPTPSSRQTSLLACRNILNCFGRFRVDSEDFESSRKISNRFGKF